MKFTKRAIIAAPADKVWGVFAHDFDDAHEWMASIPHSYGKAVGEQFDGATSAGRVCELNDDPNGLKASEQFLDYDEQGKTCTIRVDFVNTPSLFPIHHNELTFSVTESGSGSCETTWAVRSRLKPHGYLLYPLLRIGLSVLIGQVIGELKYFSDTLTLECSLVDY